MNPPWSTRVCIVELSDLIWGSVLEPVKTLVLRYNTSVSNLCSEVKTCEHVRALARPNHFLFLSLFSL